MKFNLPRFARGILNAPPPSDTSPAGPTGSEVVHEKPVGSDQVTGSMDRRPAAYPRRTYASRSWERPGQKWQWGSDGKLKMKTLDAIPNYSRLIVVVPPGVSPVPETNRQVWNALAPIAAHRRTPYSRLFIGSRA